MPILLILAMAGCNPPRSQRGTEAAPGEQARAATRSGGFPIWWSSTELGIRSLEDIDSELAKPFEGAITVTNPAREKSLVADCASARSLLSQGYAAQYPGDLAALGAWHARCQALETLKSAKPAVSSFMPTAPYSPKIVESLPAALAPGRTSSQRMAIERAGKNGEPIRMVEATVAFQAAQDEEIHIAGEGWQETLAVLAKADFDNDRRQDWLVRADLLMERGTHRISRLFLLTRNSPDEVLLVTREFK